MYYPRLSLEGLKKTTKNLAKDKGFLGLYSKVRLSHGSGKQTPLSMLLAACLCSPIIDSDDDDDDDDDVRTFLRNACEPGHMA
jgi:hypothetical protein